ncbi:xanthine dehydrogenase family protein molybdopterin-binding subunit [Beijerinckia sp. GAS462]|uniref:xanthine dehydrogenase family protein molybdopterin-binding subunit n=1 Tax=Beijerinckia sp. GAS462 TaxID=3039852 RepID=UPI002478952E|nr:xanthine dehydrogenase family protein molybdopterin-binding subunit [Beijerinckia sp. GAS462]
MPRRAATRLVSGKGRYTDDINVAGLLHVAFVRSPYPHARIVNTEVNTAKAMTGVVAVLTADDLAPICLPWQTRLALLPGHLSPPQMPLALGETCWQGEAIVAVVATSRAIAEDAAECVEIEWAELPAVADMQVAALPGAALVNSAMATNLGLDHAVATGDPDAALRDAAVVVEHSFSFDRQTGVTLEPRTIVAEFEPRLRQLTVHHSHQVPHQMRDIFAAQLKLPLSHVRVVTPDVGGAFGMKLSAYPDEMAVAAIAVLLEQPVKFCADRLESFVSDNHAREAKVQGRMAVDANGKLMAMDISVVSGFGAYSAYPRGSVGEGLQAVHMAAASYSMAHLRGRVRGYFQNKAPSGVLRGVGQPIATTVTEQLLDLAARQLNLDPAEIRRRNYVDATTATARSAGGIVLAELSLQRCHDRLMQLMDYDALRQQQRALRDQGIYRGIGLAAFMEQTAVGPALYGAQNVRASAQEACRLTLEPDGGIRCATSITDQGQGTGTALAQIIADTLGVDIDTVEVATGDTQLTPFGGGAWASRGTALGGEAALRAARRLQESILTIAGALLQADAAVLKLEGGQIYNAAGLAQMTLADVATTACFKAHLLSLTELPPLEITESFAPRDLPYVAANGIQAAHVEIDVELGTIRVLDFWVVDDCGRVINPLLVDEQIRGGVVQGIGAALYEQCIYSADAQLENGSLVDYLVPMASEMPDIHVAHVQTPTSATTLGARGVGEAGTVGAGAAIWTAVNDALAPFGAVLSQQPFTPERVLDGLAAARGKG